MRQKTFMMVTAVVTALSLQAALACGCGCSAKKAEAKKAACTTCTKDKASSKCSVKKHEKTIDTAALKKAIESKAVVVLDARSGKWDDGSRIPSAKQLSPTADAKAIVEAVGADKNAKIITYCSNLKCGASNKLATRLKKEGYTNVTEYPVGIAGWVKDGNKVEKK